MTLFLTFKAKQLSPVTLPLHIVSGLLFDSRGGRTFFRFLACHRSPNTLSRCRIVALSHCRVVATTCTTNTGDEAKAGQGDGTRLAGTVLAAR